VQIYHGSTFFEHRRTLKKSTIPPPISTILLPQAVLAGTVAQAREGSTLDRHPLPTVAMHAEETRALRFSEPSRFIKPLDRASFYGR